MLQDLNGKVVPHPTEYIVMLGDETTPITKRIAYNRIASFVNKSHALAFAKSITSFHTAVIDPNPTPNNELVITGAYRQPFDNSPIWVNGQCITLKPEGWDG